MVIIFVPFDSDPKTSLQFLVQLCLFFLNNEVQYTESFSVKNLGISDTIRVDISLNQVRSLFLDWWKANIYFYLFIYLFLLFLLVILPCLFSSGKIISIFVWDSYHVNLALPHCTSHRVMVDYDTHAFSVVSGPKSYASDWVGQTQSFSGTLLKQNRRTCILLLLAQRTPSPPCLF